MQAYGFYDPLQHNAIILREAEKNMPEKYKLLGITWIRAAIVEMTAMKERDKATVLNMVSKKQSGILFIGWWHLDSIANMLNQRCLQENGIPSKNKTVLFKALLLIKNFDPKKVKWWTPKLDERTPTITIINCPYTSTSEDKSVI